MKAACVCVCVCEEVGVGVSEGSMGVCVRV